MNVQSLVESNNSFAFDLYSKFSEAKGNLCISPFSIYTALAMTYAGARNSTEKQMKDAMHISLTQSEFHQSFAQLHKQITAILQETDIELLLANSIYPYDKYSLLEDFVTCLKENYEAIVTPLDYNDFETARKFINQWVDGKTKSHIPELIPGGVLDQLTRLVLVNAIYFKGLWEKKFDKQDTVNSPFQVSNEKFVTIPMMRQKSKFRFTEDNQSQILELPYQGESLSLIIVLPKEKDGLAQLEKSLSQDNLSKWLTRLFQDTVDVHLPLFKIKSNFNMNETLISMGMPAAFDMDRADFSGMDGTKELSIQHVFHQVTVDVNEEGATTTAATAVVMMFRGLPQEYQFHANHPFIYLLRENKTGSILFIGRVVNPAI